MKSLCVAFAGCVLLAGCGGKKRVQLPVARIGATQTGVASWYGHPYHGRRAANGEIYDMEKMTAAHRTLPFGTWVRVTVCFKKSDGKWLVTHEHVSAPIDVEKGKALLDLKP